MNVIIEFETKAFKKSLESFEIAVELNVIDNHWLDFGFIV